MAFRFIGADHASHFARIGGAPTIATADVPPSANSSRG
jgi:hypothetical protein